MNANWFDRLARDVARGMSRREAVRLLAGSTAMAVFGSWVRPTRVTSARGGLAQDDDCKGIRTFYRPDCQNPIPKQNYKPSINGCGPEGGVFGTGINAVPNSPFYLANFRPACNTHDEGYGTCNRPKSETDWQFLVDMNVICNNEYPGAGMFDSVLRSDCKYAATTFYTAVKDGGADAYKAGQADACDCCDECPGGAPKCGGICCPKDRVCENGACCEPCSPGWIKCPVETNYACKYGCCNPATPVCCPGKGPGRIRCCKTCNGNGGCSG